MLTKIAKKTLTEIDTERLLGMSDMNEVATYLIHEVPIFNSKRDIVLFLLDYSGKALAEDDFDLPIRYYAENEEIDKTPIKDDGEENLTDEFIKNQSSVKFS